MNKEDEFIYFIENNLNIKLYNYQKQYLKQIVNQNNLYITHPYHMGYINYKYLIYIIKNIIQYKKS